MHAWVAACTDALYTEGAVAILHALDALSPNTQEARDVVRQMRAYVESNAARMDYPAFVAAAWPIGSDMIETQCTTLVQARLKGAGIAGRTRAPRRSPRCARCRPQASGPPSGQHIRPRRVCTALHSVRPRRLHLVAHPTAPPPPAATGAHVSAPPMELPPERIPSVLSRRPAATHPWRLTSLAWPCSA